MVPAKDHRYLRHPDDDLPPPSTRLAAEILALLLLMTIALAVLAALATLH